MQRISILILFFLALGVIALAGSAMAATQEEADAFLAAGEWEAAAGAYEQLLAAAPDNAQNQFNLGAARASLGQDNAALKAFLKARALGYTPLPRVHFQIARMHMRRGEKKKALKALEEMAALGGPNWKAVRDTVEFEPLADDKRFTAVLDALKPCTDETYRQFDFWLGKWDVTRVGAASPTARSEITLDQERCAVIENYQAGYFTGISVSFYDAAREVWHQTWISNAGGALYMDGGVNDAGAMVMSDKGLATNTVAGAINKTTWTPNEDGSVRQTWESSTDNGETWSVVFDGVYTRRD